MTAGQAGDNPQLLPLLDDYRHASADRLGSTDFPLTRRQGLLAQVPVPHYGLKINTPSPNIQIDRRKAKGSAGRRPTNIRRALYRLQHRRTRLPSTSSGAASQPADKYAMATSAASCWPAPSSTPEVELRSGRHALAETSERASRQFRPANRRLSSRSAPIGDYFNGAGRRNSPATAVADSRMLIVALRTTAWARD